MMVVGGGCSEGGAEGGLEPDFRSFRMILFCLWLVSYCFCTNSPRRILWERFFVVLTRPFVVLARPGGRRDIKMGIFR